jgi:hypothetical protein
MVDLKESASRFDFSRVLPKPNDWVGTSFNYEGRGTAELGAPKATVAGPFVAHFDDEGNFRIETVFDTVSPHDPDYGGPSMALLLGAKKTQSGQSAQWVFSGMNNPCESLTFEADQGTFESTGRVDWAGYNFGTEPARLRFYIREGKLETRNTRAATYFAMPLVNCIADPANHLCRDHPLRIYPTPSIPDDVPADLKNLAAFIANQNNSVVGFSVDGGICFVERLADYDARAASLRNGAARRKITAVLVGEVGNNPVANLADFRSWFPFDILSALSFASGTEVGFPWIEIRDCEGSLIRRLHGGARMPSFSESYATFGKFSRPGAGDFIIRFISLPRDKRRILQIVMNHVRMGSFGSRLYLYDIVDHLVRALDAMSREHQFTQQNLLSRLDSANQHTVKQIVSDTSSKLLELANTAKLGGNLDSFRLLKRIESRAENIANAENMLGLAAVELLAKFGLPDVEVLDSFLASVNRPDWANLISTYRNATLHEGYLDFETKHDPREVASVSAHLKDALTRIVLKECGYVGTYDSVLRGGYGPQSVDWVTPATSAEMLGF